MKMLLVLRDHLIWMLTVTHHSRDLPAVRRDPLLKGCLQMSTHQHHLDLLGSPLEMGSHLVGLLQCEVDLHLSFPMVLLVHQ